MKKIVALTRHQRTTILKQLTVEQIQALDEFVRYAMLSQFHTRHYLQQTDWRLVGVVIDPEYHRDHGHHGRNLYCDCGRRLKNQFVLQSRQTGKRLGLGISHFQQHTSIPQQVIREIKAGLNQINIYRDQVLLAYQRGQSFPHQMYQRVLTQGGFKNHEGTLLFQRCQLFSRVNLPLTPQDFNELSRLATLTSQRLTKKDIEQLLAQLTIDWRQVDQQVILFNYQLRKLGLTVQELHRIKSNSVNYALQRRKTRFFIHDYKQLQTLTLNKARAQLAIKLRQLLFYVQLLENTSLAKLYCEQARQCLYAHGIKVGHSRYYGLQEGKNILIKACR